MAIQVLDQSTINQIAAGEVVERPSSVVKELMENAIDAGATAVTVEIRDGGIGFIRITDNGCGIPGKEIPLAFLRHSTSKIKNAADLMTVSSLGFRGEALSSIAAVSQVELITKTADSISGFRYQIEGGMEKSLEEIGAPDGTTFISRNLFFNTPARRKFLKTSSTEGAHVADLVEKIALSHPEVSIRLIVNGQNRLHTSGNHNLKDIIYTVYGREIAAQLIAVSVETEMVKITGFIGKPVIARGNRNFENYFINGRYIKSSLISKAIEDGYKSYMMQHKYPFTLLHFEIEPEFIDVNVHPSKMELRFKDGEFMYRTVYHAVADALSERELIPEVAFSEEKKENPGEGGSGKNLGVGPAADGGLLSFSPKKPQHGPEPFEVKRMEAMGIREPAVRYGEPENRQRVEAGSWGTESAARENQTKGYQAQTYPVSEQNNPENAGTKIRPAQKEAARESAAADMAVPDGRPPEKPEKQEDPQQMELFDNRLLSEQARYHHRLIGQVFDTYWLVEYNGQLYIIDQHAAHEKVLFEKTFASLKTREYTSQVINPPIILTLSLQEEELLKRYLDVFEKVGFEIEPFGGNEYAVRAVPDNLFSLAKKELLLEMLDSLSEDTGAGTFEMVYDRIATMSCKAAVKGNNRLSDREANELIDQLLKLDNPYACPHGRPTIVSISKYEMEKKFKRIV